MPFPLNEALSGNLGVAGAMNVDDAVREFRDPTRRRSRIRGHADLVPERYQDRPLGCRGFGLEYPVALSTKRRSPDSIAHSLRFEQPVEDVVLVDKWEFQLTSQAPPQFRLMRNR